MSIEGGSALNQAQRSLPGPIRSEAVTRASDHHELPRLRGNPLLEARARIADLSPENPVVEELRRRYAFGVPTPPALELIAAASPAGIVELGAGTGYWARLLHQAGVDVVAYDRWPPPCPENPFFAGSEPWYPVLPGDVAVIGRHVDRMLLVVWPTRNETWPAGALAHFHAAGGERVVFVGEGPGGRTGDSVFHCLLGDEGRCLSCELGVADTPCTCGIRPLWQATSSVEVGSWPGVDDDCIVYERVDDRRFLNRRRRRKPWTGEAG